MNANYINLCYDYFKEKLRDHKAELKNDVTRVRSSLVLAHNGGNYFPGIVLGDAKQSKEGYNIYFIHNKEETDVPTTSIIGNFYALLDKEISFVIDDRIYTGLVLQTDSKAGKGTPKHFFVKLPSNHYYWVPLPDIFLNSDQFRSLMADP